MMLLPYPSLIRFSNKRWTPGPSFFLFLGFLFLGVVAFGQALHNPFVFDDAAFVFHNEWLAWRYVPHFFRSFIPTSDLSFVGYRPLILMSFVVESELWNQAPWAMRLTNLAIHVTNAFLVYRIFCRRVRYALFVALVFLLHPIMTNVMCLVWKRSDLFLGLGVLVSIYFFGRWAQSQDGPKALVMAYVGVVVAFLSKESALILPLALCLVDQTLWIPVRNLRERLLVMYGPIFIVWAMHAWLIFVKMPAVLSSVGFQSQSYMPPSMLWDRWTYFQTQAVGLLTYLKLSFWPVHLNVFHHMRAVHSAVDPQFVLGVTILLSLLGIALLQRRKCPLVCFAILWFLIFLIPGSSLVPLSLPLDEDRLYLSLIAVGLMAGLGLETMTRVTHTPLLGVFLRITPVILLSLYMLHDVFRVRIWKEPISLWSMNVQDEPSDPRAWVNLAQAYSEAGKGKKAEMAFRRTIELEPEYGVAWFFWGVHQLTHKRPKDSVHRFVQSFRLDTFPSNSLMYLGVSHSLSSSPGTACRYFSLSLHRDPANAMALRNWVRFAKPHIQKQDP